jgi:hypothetical protein
MELLNKKELNDLLGKIGFLESPIELIAKIEYLGGIDVFDSLLDGQTQKEYGAVIHIIKRPHGLQIKLTSNFSSKSIGILDNQIDNILIEHKDAIIKNKDKSLIGRAVVGGVLLGPLGAVIGGMSGLKNGEEIILPDSILLFDGEIDKDKFKIAFSCNKKNLIETKSFFDNLAIPIEEIMESDTNKVVVENSKYDNLEKLAKLYKDGILTNEEFEKEKSKLLG